MTLSRRLFRLQGLALWLMALSLVSGCATYPTADSLEFREFTLDNGLHAILVREAKAPVVVSQLWYRVGAADEVTGKTGLAHMLEHMMFQGTEKVPPEEFSRIISRQGGDDNAFTSWDFTTYHVKIAADRLELALELEADRMRNLRLSDKEFRSENMVVQEERRTRIDGDPNARLGERFRREVFRVHPYGRPIIGWMPDIRAHRVADLEAWYRRYYAPNNAVLVVVGDLDPAGTEGMVRRIFGTLAPDPGLPERRWPQEPPVEAPRRVVVEDPAARLPLWMGAFHVPSLARSEEESHALDLLYAVLGGSSGRLHRRLVVEEKLAVSAGASYGGLAREGELFKVTAVPRSGVAMERLERAVLAELAELATTPLGERELEKARNGLIADSIYTRDSVFQMAYLIGQLATNGLDWRLFLDYPRRIRQVGAESVRQVAARYLQPEAMTVGILLPKRAGKGRGAGERAAGEAVPGSGSARGAVGGAS